MPVRIYDISKKLGLENKAILAKAKSLGIAAAKVPSSSLDKISAEFLEEELFKDHPEIAAKFKAPPAPAVEAPKPAPVEEKIVVIKPRRRSPNRRSKPEPVKAERRRRWSKRPKPPPPPPKPAGPKVGDKVGFIQLPHTAAPAESARSRPNPASKPASTGRSRQPVRRRPGAGTRAPTRPRGRRARPPRRSRNLSRRRPARSSSSNRRLSSANWPGSSSRSRSRSSPI